MLVTGVQAAGSKGLTAVQGTVVDLKATRAGFDGDQNVERALGSRVKRGDPQPVVFPRAGLPMDHRPASLRHEHAAARYRSDGGGEDRDDAA
jgi:hypothetical protein